MSAPYRSYILLRRSLREPTALLIRPHRNSKRYVAVVVAQDGGTYVAVGHLRELLDLLYGDSYLRHYRHEGGLRVEWRSWSPSVGDYIVGFDEWYPQHALPPRPPPRIR